VEILAKHLGVTDKLGMKSGLEPNDGVPPTIGWTNQISEQGIESIAIVAHLPFLDKLASLLVTGTDDAYVIAFKNGGIIRLVPNSARDRYSIEWIITPDTI
jgi:phosphohistidine phosphatase